MNCRDTVIILIMTRLHRKCIYNVQKYFFEKNIKVFLKCNLSWLGAAGVTHTCSHLVQLFIVVADRGSGEAGLPFFSSDPSQPANAWSPSARADSPDEGNALSELA